MNESFGKHALPELPFCHDRRALVVERCRGKRVLHVGCADTPYTAERLASGDLLHARIRDVAEDLWGLDLDADALALLRDAGYDQLVVADLCADWRGTDGAGTGGTGRGATEGSPSASSASSRGLRWGPGSLLGRDFDLIVATEVIEHLLCPGKALENLAGLMVPGHTQLLVTVPNAYRIDTILGLLRGHELVHPDHNAWYSWYTATNLLRKAGFVVRESGFYGHRRPGLVPSSLADLGARTWSRVKAAALARRAVGRGDGPRALDMRLGRGALERERATTEHATGRTVSLAEWIERMRGYLSHLPPRLLVTLLAARPALWADGIYVVAEVRA